MNNPPPKSARVKSELAVSAANKAFLQGASPAVALRAAKNAVPKQQARKLTYTPHTGRRERERAEKFARVKASVVVIDEAGVVALEAPEPLTGDFEV